MHLSCGNWNRKFCFQSCSRGSYFHFFICAAAILISFMCFGILQEQVFQGNYGDGERYTFTFSTLFVGTFSSTLYAVFMIFISGTGFQDSTPKLLFVPLALTHLLSVSITVGSLQRVSYPVVVVVKSVKPIFVMLCAALIGKVRYSTHKYFVVCIVVLGVILFMYTPSATAGNNVKLAAETQSSSSTAPVFQKFTAITATVNSSLVNTGDVKHSAKRLKMPVQSQVVSNSSNSNKSDGIRKKNVTLPGLRRQKRDTGKVMLDESKEKPKESDQMVISVSSAVSNREKERSGDVLETRLFWSTDTLLFVSLVFDGLTAGQQERMKAKYSTSAYSMMFYMDLLVSLYLLVPLSLTNEFSTFLLFCEKHTKVIRQIVYMIAATAIGQSFVFLVIDAYGSLPCSLITTGRKFLTVLFSMVFFAHGVSWYQYAGITLVFGALISGELHSVLKDRFSSVFRAPKSTVSSAR